MTYDQLLLSTHTGTFRFSYPGSRRCAITAERQIIFACDGTPAGCSTVRRKGRIGRRSLPQRQNCWRHRYMRDRASMNGGVR